MNGLGVDPSLFFSTAAGPNAMDIYGPPSSSLDMYANGVPVTTSQSQIANGVGGGGSSRLPFLGRRDVHGLLFLILGGVMLHLHSKATD